MSGCNPAEFSTIWEGYAGTSPVSIGGKVVATLSYRSNKRSMGHLFAQLILEDGTVVAQFVSRRQALDRSVWRSVGGKTLSSRSRPASLTPPCPQAPLGAISGPMAQASTLRKLVSVASLLASGAASVSSAASLHCASRRLLAET